MGRKRHGFHIIAAGDQFSPDVRRARLGTDAGRCGGLGRAGCRPSFDCRLVSVGDRGTDRRPVDGPVIDVDGCRGRPVCGMDEKHRVTGRASGQTGQSGGHRLRNGFRRNGAAASGCCQSQPADGPGGDEYIRAEHPDDRDDRNPVRRDVGPGRRGNVWLRGFVGSCDHTDAVHLSAGHVQSAVSSAQQALSAIPNALNSLATPAATSAAALSPLDLLDLSSDLISILLDVPANLAGLGADTPLTLASYYPDVASYYIALHTDGIVSGWAGAEGWPGAGPVPPTPFPVITKLGSAVSAGMGEANTIGRLSVPAGWTAAAPEIRPLAVALPATSVGAAAEVSTGSTGSLFSQMALAGMAGRAMAGTAGTGGPGRRERIGAATRKPTEPGEPTQPPQTSTGGPITSIAAELRELASLRDSGILTDEEFTEQKRLLLPH